MLLNWQKAFTLNCMNLITNIFISDGDAMIPVEATFNIHQRK